MGPGVKIYRGKLHAERNTIAFSCRGANVVANGGQVVLESNEIYRASGDGVSAWNNSSIRLVRKSSHADLGGSARSTFSFGEVGL